MKTKTQKGSTMKTKKTITKVGISAPSAVVEAHGYKLTPKAAAHARSGKKFAVFLSTPKDTRDFTQYAGADVSTPDEWQAARLKRLSGKEMLEIAAENERYVWEKTRTAYRELSGLVTAGLVVPSNWDYLPEGKTVFTSSVEPSNTKLDALVYKAYDGAGASFVVVDAERAPRHLHTSLKWHRRAWSSLPGLKQGSYDPYPFTGTALVAEAKHVFTNFTGFFGHIGPDGIRAEAGIPVWTSVEV